MHQLAYLTPKRAVAWKCLSLQAIGRGSTRQFAPVAYASLSGQFFPGMEDVRSPGVLWVISSPKYKQRGIPEHPFPPTLIAKLTVRRVVTGEEVHSWAHDARDCALEVPSDDQQFQEWRQASSVRGPARRAAFRISRDFAMLAWSQRHQRVRGCHSQREAWSRVRTAMADLATSSFLAHVDATDCLGRALALPNSFVRAGSRMQSPRTLLDDDCVAELEQLAEAGTHHTIFMNYRWNEKANLVAKIAQELLALRCGVWLDGLALPHFQGRPVWRIGGRARRKDPPGVDLERLLLNGIEASALFLCLAAEDYEEPPRHDPKGENWAMREYRHGVMHAAVTGVPIIRVVDLGNAPSHIVEPYGQVFKYEGNAAELAAKILAFARRH
jgi:hypothetical protein